MTTEERICGHCGRPMKGYASIGKTWLCHPDDGMDCYQLVTLYGHGVDCLSCQVKPVLANDASSQAMARTLDL